MLAIGLTLKVIETQIHHPVGSTAAYRDIATTLRGFGFQLVQKSVFICKRDDLANLHGALRALKAMWWFPLCVGEVRVCRVEMWSDFTDFMKS